MCVSTDLPVQSESVWFSEYGTETEQMSSGYFDCPWPETPWEETNEWLHLDLEMQKLQFNASLKSSASNGITILKLQGSYHN